jgi:hypothetical protein
MHTCAYSSIVSTSFQNNSHPSGTPTALPAPLEPLPPRKSHLSAKLLRRRARSHLVDAYARFIIPHLRNSLWPAGLGYPAWIARSMLRRCEDHMDWLMRDFGGHNPFNKSAFGPNMLISDMPMPSPSSTLFDDNADLLSFRGWAARQVPRAAPSLLPPNYQRRTRRLIASFRPITTACAHLCVRWIMAYAPVP